VTATCFGANLNGRFPNRFYLARIERGKDALRPEHALRYEILFDLPMVTEIAAASLTYVANGFWEDITAALHDDTGLARPIAAGKRNLLVAALARIESLSN
jgi:hypothetical protein